MERGVDFLSIRDLPIHHAAFAARHLSAVGGGGTRSASKVNICTDR